MTSRRPAARFIAGAFAVLAATTLLAASPAFAEPEIGSPKWAAGQFKRLKLKVAPNDYGYLKSLRVKQGEGRQVQVAAVLPGTDPLLGRDYILVLGRLDPGGEAAVIGAARALTAAPVRRSVVFVLSDANETELQLPVAADRIVAQLDLEGLAPGGAGLTLTGADETSLGRDATNLATMAGLAVARLSLDDRSDGFMALGAPAIRIGLPSGDDRFSGYLSSLVARIAGRDERPRWALHSRFAPPAPRAERLLTDPVDMPVSRHQQRAPQANG